MKPGNKLINFAINFFVTTGLIGIVFLVLVGISSLGGNDELIDTFPVPSLNEFLSFVKSNLVFYSVVFAVFLILITVFFLAFYKKGDYPDLQAYIKDNIEAYPVLLEALVVSLIIHSFVCFGHDFSVSLKLTVFVVIFVFTTVLVLMHFIIYLDIKKNSHKKQGNLISQKALIFFLIFAFILAKDFSLNSIYASMLQRIEDFFAIYLIMYLITIIFSSAYSMNPFTFIVSWSILAVVTAIVLSVIYYVFLIIFKFSFRIQSADFEPLTTFISFITANSFRLFRMRNIYDLVSILLIIGTMTQFVSNYQRELNIEFQEELKDRKTRNNLKANIILLALIGLGFTFVFTLSHIPVIDKFFSTIQ